MSPPLPSESTPASPYAGLPDRAFWRSAVRDCAPEAISGLWQPKFQIRPDDPVASYGSCFAQHIGRALAARGYTWLQTERPPQGVSPALAQAHGYDLFSARTGNVYTPSLLLQWIRWALGDAAPPDEVWPDGARLRDPFRPTLEPEGFADARELGRLRRVTLRAFRKSLREARFLVFTLGLTERWVHLAHGQEYPLCPGTAAGIFDPACHGFAPLDYAQALDALAKALDLMRRANPGLRFLLTVSPVPLAATASGAHVLSATAQSKAILRTVAGALAAARADTDYFPSFELITSPVFRGRFYAPDKRHVTPEGVRFVMDSFFNDMAAQFGSTATARSAPDSPGLKPGLADVVCEEELLDAFGRQGQ